jgi:hypothetical protein
MKMNDALGTSHKNITENIKMYGCENWSVHLRVEHRLRVLGNRVLREMFSPEWDKVMGVEKIA